MRVSVIITMPAENKVRVLSSLAFSTTRLRETIPEPTKKAGLILDPSFPPLPLSARNARRINLAAATVEAAPAFVMRGTVEAESVDSIRNPSRGVQIFADPQIGTLKPLCSDDGAKGTHSDVARLLDVKGLHDRGLTGKNVAVAIMDTGINLAHLKSRGLNPKLDRKVFWAPPGAPHDRPGEYEVDHGTMCAFDALIAAPECTLLDFPVLQSTTPGGSMMGGFLSDALLAFSYLRDQLTGNSWKYSALVINNSWGMYDPSWDFPADHPGRYADNPNHPFNLIVGTMEKSGADILFAAGNCGADCPNDKCRGVVKHSITGANAHPGVLTVAGCDIDGERVGYSSQGPAIPGMAENKPDVTSYTHFLGSEALGTGMPDDGTSTACPVAAGCVAAIRTRLSPSNTPPKDLFKELIATADSQPVAAGSNWNYDYGGGVLRPITAAVKLGL
jgi:subtilisin family serine protease